jgi:CheY-like chemotaxis protein
MEPLRILIIDDESGLRTSMATLLRLQGNQVIEAMDGREALDLLADHPLDLVVTDYQMPRLDGLEFIAEAQAAGYTFPIILYSGDSRTVITANAAGIEAYDKDTEGLEAILSRAQTLRQDQAQRAL